jgi:hypothetical protein
VKVLILWCAIGTSAFAICLTAHGLPDSAKAMGLMAMLFIFTTLLFLKVCKGSR